MMVNNRKRYIVRHKKTGQVLAKGSAKECAKSLRIKQGTFYIAVSKSKDGIGPYLIESFQLGAVTDMTCIEQAKPCHTCDCKESCDRAALNCRKWQKWFTSSYDLICSELRKIYH